MPVSLEWTALRQPIEIRVGTGIPIARFHVSNAPRGGTGPLFISPPEAMGTDALPAILLPLLDNNGRRVPQALLALPQEQTFLQARLLLPGDHPRVVQDEGATDQVQVVDAVWLPRMNETRAEEIGRTANLIPGLIIRSDEKVIPQAGDITTPRSLYLRRLPRIVFADHQLIADNTDSALSMGALLSDFVRRFSKKGSALPQVRVASGYLYHHGFEQLLDLLRNDGIQSLQVLFSGHTDARTARAVTGQLVDQIIPGVERDATGERWRLYRDALASGRLEFRVYTDAFLHAKLFLGWDARDDYGKLIGSYAVVGSSNLSTGGLSHTGNLELDVTLQNPDINTRLADWFEYRWEEASVPEPGLLQVLENHRPQPPPVFATPGLLEVWEAGQHARLGSPEEHLALLAHLYKARLARVRLPDDLAFPAVDDRAFTPSTEQEEGVLALAQRLLTGRVGFLADSVGLGKTITAIGTAWYLARQGRASRTALIAPRKLLVNWQSDAAAVGAPDDVFQFLNRHELERKSPDVARTMLAPFDLLIVEEAHETLRNRSNKLWGHLRAHLASHPECRLLLVSATPWNNRREDIFNYLLLAWQDGRRLASSYAALDVEPLASHLGMFMLGSGGSLSPAQAVRRFDSLPSDAWRRLFDESFVQRTRSSLVRRYGAAPDYPERRVHARVTPTSDAHDALFASLSQALSEFTIPYQEPLRALLIAGAATGEDTGEVEPSNLRRSFLTQLFKRAESSEFALAVSLAGIERKLSDFSDAMRDIARASSPRAALERWVEARLAQTAPDDQEELFEEDEAPAEDDGVLSTQLRGLVARIDDRRAVAMAKHVREEQITPDLARIRALRARLTLDLDEQSPKGLLLAGLARDALAHRPILVAGYADTAIRTFIRMVSRFPDKRIGLALGGDEAFLYLPTISRARELTDDEWQKALSSTPEQRRQLLVDSGRARRIPRADLLAAFAPQALRAQAELLVRTGGPIDILVGSEAISVGQNLQDSTCLIQLDLPWNPMVIEQRIGRIDRRGGGRVDPETGRRIVDVYYCWSSAAIEEEVALRERLKAKAEQAIADTRFDELLLHELHEEIKRVRRDPDRDANGGLGAFLGARQQELADGRTLVAGIAPGSGSNLDGLRHLARWKDLHDSVSTPEPVVAAAATGSESSARWLVTIELTPKTAQGKPIAGAAYPVQLPLEGATAPDVGLLPDLEAVVSGLLHAGEAAQRPGVSRTQWAQELKDVDAQLVAFRDATLHDHNSEVNAALLALQTPAAARAPGEKLKRLLREAQSALTAEIRRLPGGPHESLLTTQKERLAYLSRIVLDDKRAVDLLVHEDEETLLRHLAALKALPFDFLTRDFEARFDELCGRAWAAFQGTKKNEEAPVQQALSAAENLWGGLDLRVLAATFTQAE